MQKDIVEIKEILNNHIYRLIEDYNIKLLYIFGSYAKGTNIATSDLDIAVYLEGDPEGFVRLDVLDDLVGIFNRGDIDLVILNNVDVELQFQVIKYGELLYMDMEHFRSVQNEIIHLIR